MTPLRSDGRQGRFPVDHIMVASGRVRKRCASCGAVAKGYLAITRFCRQQLRDPSEAQEVLLDKGLSDLKIPELRSLLQLGVDEAIIAVEAIRHAQRISACTRSRRRGAMGLEHLDLFREASRRVGATGLEQAAQALGQDHEGGGRQGPAVGRREVNVVVDGWVKSDRDLLLPLIYERAAAYARKGHRARTHQLTSRKIRHDHTVFLEVDDIEAIYVRRCGFARCVAQGRTGSIVALLGANGAGKTTTLRRSPTCCPPNAVAEPRHDYWPADDAVFHPRSRRKGVVQVLEGRQSSPVTVRRPPAGGFLRRRPPVRSKTILSVSTPGSTPQGTAQIPRGLTSGGEQQMVAIGRALMTRPVLVLLDEPSMGLAPIIVEEIAGPSPAHRISDRGQMVLFGRRK